MSARTGRRSAREVTEAAAPRRSLVSVNVSGAAAVLEGDNRALEAEVAAPGARLDDLRKSLPGLDIRFQLRDTEIAQWKQLAEELRANSDVIVVLAAGSGLAAARSMVQLLSRPLGHSNPQLVFVGDHLLPEAYGELLSVLSQEMPRVCLVAVSHGTVPLEVSTAFRLLTGWVEERHGSFEAQRRVVLVCDSDAEGLLSLPQAGQYRRLNLPDRCSSQFLATTAAGIFPLALAGHDVSQFVEGARSQARGLDRLNPAEEPCLQYALTRHRLMTEHQFGEVLMLESPAWDGVGQWWKGLMTPTSAAAGIPLGFPMVGGIFSHLYLFGAAFQSDQRPGMFSTWVRLGQFRHDPELEEGVPLSTQFLEARQAIYDAQSQNVPALVLSIDRQDLFSCGALFGFFEVAAGISHKLLDLGLFSDSSCALYACEPGQTA